MAITEAQLEGWTGQGSVQGSANTYASIQNALSQVNNLKQNVDFEVYLQGSYKNDTNIRGDSDVDVVVQINSIFKHDLEALSLEEKASFYKTYSDATYTWSDFKRDVFSCLRNYYGWNMVDEGNKSLKVKASGNRLPADVVVCIQYRKYKSFYSFGIQNYVEGMCFWTRDENRLVINFPKRHYDNGVYKNASTNGMYKPIIRMMKNARRYLVDNKLLADGVAPGYFIECLLFNAPNNLFKRPLYNTYLGLISWMVTALKDSSYQNFLCQNQVTKLYGNEPEQWNVNDTLQYIQALLSIV